MADALSCLGPTADSLVKASLHLALSLFLSQQCRRSGLCSHLPLCCYPAGTFSSMADALSCLGPTADDLVKDYAEAYASMKEDMEIRLRHEQRRGDFLQVIGPAPQLR